MNITEETKSGLKLVASLTDEEFSTILKVTFGILLRRCSEEELSKGVLGKMDPLKTKRAFASLVCVIVEGGKANSSAIQLSGVLQEFKISQNRRAEFSKMYEENFSELRGLLARTGFNFPHIVGTDWRMDYCIKTDTLGHVGKPIYYISLKTEKNLKLPESSVTEIPKMEQENVDFTCNLEELQDLVSKLKDATKQMERVQSELTP